MGSISEICRATGINRQQFNKYLAGNHAPSAQNLTRIADQFGVDTRLLGLPHDEFRQTIDGNTFRSLETLLSLPKRSPSTT